jgi:hypothetical protein
MGKRSTVVAPFLLWGACGTDVVPTNPHSSDGPSDISGPLLLALIVATVLPTSAAHCYSGGTWHGHDCYYLPQQ